MLTNRRNKSKVNLNYSRESILTIILSTATTLKAISQMSLNIRAERLGKDLVRASNKQSNVFPKQERSVALGS